MKNFIHYFSPVKNDFDNSNVEIIIADAGAILADLGIIPLKKPSKPSLLKIVFID